MTTRSSFSTTRSRSVRRAAGIVMPKRILNDGLNVDRRQMRFAMGLLHGVRTHAVFIHRQRHQRDAEPGGDALDERIGQRLDAAAAAGRHHGSQRRRDALPAVGGEHHLLGLRRPILVLAGKIIGSDFSQRLRSGAGRLPQRDIECFRPVQSLKALGDQRRLRRQQRIIEFQVDLCAARLGRRGDRRGALLRR